jgi:phosphate transport system substrate-binding protein
MALILTLSGVVSCSKNEIESLKIYGSTTISTVMEKVAKEYGPSGKMNIEIKAIGSLSGIDSLIAGTCDIAMSSVEIEPDQITRAKKAGISLKPFLIGYDIIVPIVNPSNTVSDITINQLQEIYSGSIYRWSAVGGADTIIDFVDRDNSSGTHDIWHNDIFPKVKGGNAITIQPSNSAVTAYVSGHKNALGYISFAFYNPEVKILKLDGISITESDSLPSQYHLKRPLYLYVNDTRFDRKIKDFIIYLIINDKGRDLIRKAGIFQVAP